MIIKNFKSLATTKAKKDALQILEAGYAAAQPKNFLRNFVKKNEIRLGKKRLILSDYEKIFVIAFGKAADSMAKAVSETLDISYGIVVIPQYSKSLLSNKKFKVFYSGHPIPDKESVRAGKAVLKFANNCSKRDFVIFLVSGGGSSLLALPDQITLSEKKHVTKLLWHSGASINEFNCVRKHLSQIKGGKLVQKMNSDACALIMSDVVGNDISVISSGCTFYDKTTFSDALKVITKYSLVEKFPKKVITHIRQNLSSKDIFQKNPRIRNKIIATNQDCLDAMAAKSRTLGLKTIICPPIYHNVETSATRLVKVIPNSGKSCIIFGGEPTVDVRGNGKGGRSQELVLRILRQIENSEHDVIISSAATDGIDGNTKYSGALIENNSINTDNISYYLENNDSNSFFKKYGGLIKTGYTHTNLMDFGLIVRY